LARLTQSELGEILRFGAVTAGLNCAQKGSHPASRAEVDKVLGDSATRLQGGAN
ncbi:MAG: hypothetical protein GXP01_10525, partial [Alphaproteobacteria bacterium]|nr:hypothetical protein [Alphaproteobacteria bacterium]